MCRWTQQDSRTLWTACRIIVVEDEVILALDISLTLEDAGAKIVGPFYSLAGGAGMRGNDRGGRRCPRR